MSRAPLKLTFLLIASAALLVGCRKKDGKTSGCDISTMITGSWELRQVSSSVPVKYYAPGNGHLLVFGANSYSIYVGGQVQKTGTYSILSDSTVSTNVCLVYPAGEYTSRIRYDNNDSINKQFFQITNNTLTIVAGCFALDGGVESVYARVCN